jgi:hypothetical protein
MIAARHGVAPSLESQLTEEYKEQVLKQPFWMHTCALAIDASSTLQMCKVVDPRIKDLERTVLQFTEDVRAWKAKGREMDMAMKRELEQSWQQLSMWLKSYIKHLVKEPAVANNPTKSELFASSPNVEVQKRSLAKNR